MPQEPTSTGEGESVHNLTLAPSVAINSDPQTANASPTIAPPSGPQASSTRPSTRRQIRLTSIAVVAVLVVLIIVVAAYVFTGGFHPAKSSSSPEGIVLLPDGASYSITLGQFSGIAFHINSTSTVQGKLNSSNGVIIDLMTPAEFTHLSLYANVSGYEWSSGAVADQSIYTLDVSVPPGQWNLAFLDANVSFPTGVSFYSDLTLTPG